MKTSESCFDNILTNFFNDDVTYVLDFSMSDHTTQNITFTIETNIKTDGKFLRIY